MDGEALRRPKHAEPAPPDECRRLRRMLQLFGPDASDQWALYCLDGSGQAVTCNLYDLGDTEPITAFTKKEATGLLGYMCGTTATRAIISRRPKSMASASGPPGKVKSPSRA